MDDASVFVVRLNMYVSAQSALSAQFQSLNVVLNSVSQLVISKTCPEMISQEISISRRYETFCHLYLVSTDMVPVLLSGNSSACFDQNSVVL